MKRLFDIIFAAILLVILSPLMAVIALAVWLDEPGTIIYRGERIGRYRCPFYILKFRSMTQHPTYAQEITICNDPRMTRVGRLLRTSKLDELPQLINVLRGDMSLVGPRPESPYFVQFYTPRQIEALTVRPGITGAAQLMYRHEEKLLTTTDAEKQYIDVIMPAKIELDLDYVRHHSFWLDLKLLWLTAFALMVPFSSIQPLHQETGAITDKRGGSFSQRPSQSSWQVSLHQRINNTVFLRLRYYGLDILFNIICVACAFEVATILRFMDTPLFDARIILLTLPDILIGCLYAVIAYAMGLHRRLWNYAGMRDGLALVQSVCITALLIAILDVLNISGTRMVPISVIAGGTLLSFLFLGCARMLPRALRVGLSLRSQGIVTRVLIVGAGQAGAALASRFLLNSAQGYRVIAFMDDDPAKRLRRLHNRPIFGPISDIPTVVTKYTIDLIAIALPEVNGERMSEILSICQQTAACIKIMQGFNEMIDRPAHSLMLREVNVADLLGREVVPLQTTEPYTVLKGKVVLVTGAAGSIGSELCRQLIGHSPLTLLAVDNNETGLFELGADLHTHPNACALQLIIGDITDDHFTERIFTSYRPQIIFHAAAYKHVPLLERHIDQALRVNVLGTWQLCQGALRHAVEQFIFISSDKAADPESVLGASKRIGEIGVQALARSYPASTKFSVVRFGNVIGSRGSVVPIFSKQIKHGGPITVTDPNATRYFMTIPEACGLVIFTAAIAEQGKLYLLDMGKPVRILDLAVKMIRMHGLREGKDIAIVYTGLRPGEHLHETLVATNEEVSATLHTKILSISCKGNLPSLDMMSQWMQVLKDNLEHESDTWLHKYLFEVVREQELPVGR